KSPARSGALLCAGLCVEVTVPQDPVMQERGSSVELPCHYKTSVDKNFILEWRFAPASTILYFANDKLYKPTSQADRLSLLHDPPTMGDATLQLSNIRASDNGTYVCEVNNPPDFYGSGSGIIYLLVLMPPSTPVCKGTEYALAGSDATLTCSSTEGVPAPIYSWSRVGSKTSLPLANMVEDEQTGKLQLTNLSVAYSGTYQCVASNQFGHASCQVTVNVSGEVSALCMSAHRGCCLLPTQPNPSFAICLLVPLREGDLTMTSMPGVSLDTASNPRSQSAVINEQSPANEGQVPCTGSSWKPRELVVYTCCLLLLSASS
uniref:V-set and immunoglobulin domain containing 2 n=1 Tax=Pelusios castaneus TaxID=367368 RepID=A0A8C8RTR4_9SAUR